MDDMVGSIDARVMEFKFDPVSFLFPFYCS
jgi:hypothetical protein